MCYQRSDWGNIAMKQLHRSLTRTRIGIRAIATAALFSAALPAQQAAKPMTKAEIEEIVKQYIVEHPEVIVDSVRQMQSREQAKTQQRSRDALTGKRQELVGDPASPVSKPAAEGQVQIVEFFDYRCGYCKKVFPALQKALADNKDARLVYKEFPILGPESLVAAKAALAVAKQGKYPKFHEAMMTAPTPPTSASIEQTAGALGVDVAKMKADMESPEIAAALERNRQLAAALGVEATPTFVIGGEIVPGAVDEAGFKQLIEKAKGQAPAKP